MAEVLIENGVDLDRFVGKWELRWLDRLVVPWRCQNTWCGVKAVVGMTDVDPADTDGVFADRVFSKRSWPLYLGVDGWLHQSA